MALRHILLGVLVLLAASAVASPEVNTRYVRPIGYDEARVRARVEQAQLCYPPALLALIRSTIAALTPNATVPDAQLALFSAHFDARVRALVPVCDAYAAVASSLGRLWTPSALPFQLDLTTPPLASYVNYCRTNLAVPMTALSHSSPLLQCMRAKHFIEEASGGFNLPTQQREIV